MFHCERSNFVVIGRCRFCTCVPGCCVRRSLCFLPFAPPSCPTFEILSSPEAGNILHRIALEWRQQVDRPGLLCSCSRWPRSWHGLWHFPLHFDDPGCKILNFLNGAVLMTAWRRAGIRPIFDAISKQTNREYHHRAAGNLLKCVTYDCCRPVY